MAAQGHGHLCSHEQLLHAHNQTIQLAPSMVKQAYQKEVSFGTADCYSLSKVLTRIRLLRERTCVIHGWSEDRLHHVGLHHVRH